MHILRTLKNLIKEIINIENFQSNIVKVYPIYLKYDESVFLYLLFVEQNFFFIQEHYSNNESMHLKLIQII